MLAPGQQEHVLEAVIKNDDNFESQFLEDVAASYMSTVDWGTQRQILSIVANKVSYSKMKNPIPNYHIISFVLLENMHQVLDKDSRYLMKEEHVRE